MPDRSLLWCVTLRPTEAGGSISRHLNEIGRIVEAHSGRIMHCNGICEIGLPATHDEIRAARVVDELNRLSDDRGHSVLEAEMSPMNARMPGAMPQLS